MTSLTHATRRKSQGHLPAAAAIALGVALAVVPTLVLAETQIRGKPEAVRVEAKNASIEEILTALTNAFNVRFRSSADLDKRLTGTYEGSLQQVVAHILRGYDFFAKSGETGLEITLLGSGKAVTAIAALPTTKSAADASRSSPVDSGEQRPPTVAAPHSGAIPTIKPGEREPVVPTVVPPAAGAAPSLLPGPAAGAAPMPVPAEPGAAPTLVPGVASLSGVLKPPVPSAAPPLDR
jgi:hypothetical protein